MLDLDPADLISLVYANLIDVSGPTKDSELSMLVAPVGNTYKSGKSEPYTLRILRSELRQLRNKAKSGNLLDYQLMSRLYRTGLCFKQDEILSALWAQMPSLGAVKLPNDEIIYHSDLAKIATRHLKSLYHKSIVYAYPPDVADFYTEILSAYAQNGFKGKFALMYRSTSSTTAVLSQAVYCSDNVFVDCTAQARLFNLVPLELDDQLFSSFATSRFVVVGNILFNGKEFGDDDLKTFLTIEEASDLPSKVDEDANAFVKKYRETYRKALAYLAQKRRKPDVQAKAEKLVTAFTEADAKNRKAISASKSAYKKNVNFLALSFCKTVSRINRKLKNGEILSIPKTKASVVQRKLTEMGFTCDTSQTYGRTRKRKA